MGRYVYSRCPYCKHTLSFERAPWNDFSNDIGNPISYCGKCRKPHKNGKQRWSEMDAFEKGVIYFKVILSVAVLDLFSLLGFLVVRYVLIEMEIADIGNEIGFTVWLIGFSILGFYYYLKGLKELIKESEVN